LGGPSSGAVAYAAQQYASKLKEGDLAVIIFGDSGRAYLSKGFYDQPQESIQTAMSSQHHKQLEV
jgi:hypothetical protein